jgi:hypothetical protein
MLMVKKNHCPILNPYAKIPKLKNSVENFKLMTNNHFALFLLPSIWPNQKMCSLTLGSCQNTSKLNIKNPFFRIQVTPKMERIHEETKNKPRSDISEKNKYSKNAEH